MITCPVCGMTSGNSSDEDHGYCGNCHDWTTGNLTRVVVVINGSTVLDRAGVNITTRVEDDGRTLKICADENPTVLAEGFRRAGETIAAAVTAMRKAGLA